MAKKKVSFVTADGKKVSFMAGKKKKRKNPKRPLTPWTEYVRDNMRDTMNEFDVSAPEAMQIMAEEYHN